jgi:hypothetical protein
MKRSDGTALFVIVGMIMIGFLSPILGAQEAPTVLISASNLPDWWTLKSASLALSRP